MATILYVHYSVPSRIQICTPISRFLTPKYSKLIYFIEEIVKCINLGFFVEERNHLSNHFTYST